MMRNKSGRERLMLRGQEKKNTTPPLGTSRGLGRQSRPTGRGGGREGGGNRQREGGTPGQENSGVDRDPHTG